MFIVDECDSWHFSLLAITPATSQPPLHRSSSSLSLPLSTYSSLLPPFRKRFVLFFFLSLSIVQHNDQPLWTLLIRLLCAIHLDIESIYYNGRTNNGLRVCVLCVLCLASFSSFFFLAGVHLINSQIILWCFWYGNGRVSHLSFRETCDFYYFFMAELLFSSAVARQNGIWLLWVATLYLYGGNTLWIYLKAHLHIKNVAQLLKIYFPEA